jgi:hypothetical protein
MKDDEGVNMLEEVPLTSIEPARAELYWLLTGRGDGVRARLEVGNDA